jgi:hypothetical protein
MFWFVPCHLILMLLLWKINEKFKWEDKHL